jgi:outer membrane protein assembly factor BamE (lipoprotein component of BamABCDE complex)
MHDVVHVGNDFDLNAFTSHVNRGGTTKDQVRAWLGAPTSTGVDVDPSGQRYDKWNYYFAEGSMSHPSETKLKTLQIKLDSQGIVTPSGMPHRLEGPCVACTRAAGRSHLANADLICSASIPM